MIEPVVEQVAEPVVEPSPEPVVEPVVPQQIIPKLVFIVPYRDRETQHKFYSKHMSYILEDMPTTDYKIFYVHQCDKREFNRGAMKNIGFLHVKKEYPNDYKNITLVFNDIDIMPLVKGFINYETTSAKIKHFYGFDYTLGGIVSIKAGDFEVVNGFPNFWAWGYEDNLLQKRIQSVGMIIDRSVFYPIMDKNFIILHDGFKRNVNKTEFDRYMQQTKEGQASIRNLNYEVTSDGFINVTGFDTDVVPVANSSMSYDIRNGPRPFTAPAMGKRKARMGMIM